MSFKVLTDFLILIDRQDSEIVEFSPVLHAYPTNSNVGAPHDQQQAAQCFPKLRQKRQKVEQQILEHDQVPIDEVLHPDQVTPDQRVTLITRASIALRCIHYDIEKSLSEHDLTQLDLEPGEALGTQELLHEDLDGGSGGSGVAAQEEDDATSTTPTP